MRNRLSRTLLLISAALSGTALIGCGESSGTPTATATPSPTQSATATPASSPTASATPAPSVTPVTCQPLTGGDTSARARITDVRIGTASGIDTLAVQFDSAVTSYRLTVNPTGTQFQGGGGKGGTFTLAGTYGIRLDIYNLDWTVPPGNQFPHGTDLKQTAPVLLEVRQIGNFEGVVNIAIGVSSAACPMVSTLQHPPRLVIQFPTR